MWTCLWVTPMFTGIYCQSTTMTTIIKQSPWRRPCSASFYSEKVRAEFFKWVAGQSSSPYVTHTVTLTRFPLLTVHLYAKNSCFCVICTNVFQLITCGGDGCSSGSGQTRSGAFVYVSVVSDYNVTCSVVLTKISVQLTQLLVSRVKSYFKWVFFNPVFDPDCSETRITCDCLSYIFITVVKCLKYDNSTRHILLHYFL